MKVSLRKKPMTKNRVSLYLDFYPPLINSETGKQTRREFLSLYLYEKAKTPLDKQHNKETLILAENIKAQRQLAIQADDYGFLKLDNSNDDFLLYFKRLAEAHKLTDKGDRNNWISVYNYLESFTNGFCPIKSVNELLCKDFKEYLQKSATFVETKSKLANNSAVGYFNIFKRVIKHASREKLLSDDFGKNIPAIKKTETKREYLTLEELKILAKTDCDLPLVKNAALFSALTGLRYSDIEKLTWKEILGNDIDGYCIRFTQKKTKGVETLPISLEAHNLLGKIQKKDEKVFGKLKYSAWQNQKIQEWVYKAGIMRKISFHSFRHTFATIQLTLGTDIYTVSKMLGHRDLQTTQIYGKIVDQSKRIAADKIKLDL